MILFAEGWSENFDGPGRRLVFYCKGCNFRCRWCGNPESLSAAPEMLFYPEKSRFAAESCPNGAVQGETLDRSRCARCPERPCLKLWHNRAFEWCGRETTPEELVAEAAAKRSVWGGNGGVTFSGGEATLQAAELVRCCELLREEGISTALESNASTAGFAAAAAAVDYLICDLKCLEPARHRRLTGVDNAPVLANLTAAAVLPVPLHLRMPLIAGENFVPEELTLLTNFMLQLRARRPAGHPLKMEFLRLHQLGLPKYRALGLRCEAESWQAPTREQVAVWVKALGESGLEAEIGG